MYEQTVRFPPVRRSLRVYARAAMMCTLPLATACVHSLAKLPSKPFENRWLPLTAHSPSGNAPLSSPGERPTLPAAAADELGVTSKAGNTKGRGRGVKPLRLPVAETVAADPMQTRISVNAVNAPLDALLHALASEAGVQLHALRQVDARVTLRLEEQSLDTALSQLSDQAGFAWELTDDQLRIWLGEAYAYSYPIDYLNMDRRTQSSVGLATQVGTINAADQGAGSIANSSQTRVENLSEHHFWASLQQDLEQLIVHRYAVPSLSATTQQMASIDDHSALRVASTATTAASFTLNREAGLLNLFASPSVHQSVRKYLNTLHDSARRQVLIEATVVEVALSDSFSAGVDWRVLAESVNGVNAVQSLVGAPPVNRDTIERVVTPAGLVSLVQQGRHGDVQATLSLLEQFGDVRILSRPRIIALNNQSSVLKVVDNRVYFTVNIERRQSETRDEVVTETEIHTVPVGLVMNVTPQISSNGSVMLNVRPTLSRILGFVNDPNPELAEANVRNGVPEIQVREMESMLQVQSGSMAIIGGLMQETTEHNDSKLPGLGDLPLFGHLFSQRARSRRQTELLIVLRPTVIADDVHTVAQQ